MPCALLVFRGLCEVSAGGCRFGEEGTLALADGIKQSRTLTAIDLSSTMRQRCLRSRQRVLYASYVDVHPPTTLTRVACADASITNECSAIDFVNHVIGTSPSVQ